MSPSLRTSEDALTISFTREDFRGGHRIPAGVAATPYAVR